MKEVTATTDALIVAVSAKTPTRELVGPLYAGEFWAGRPARPHISGARCRRSYAAAPPLAPP